MHFMVSKAAVNHAANATCTFATTFTDPQTGETFSVAGTVEGAAGTADRLGPANAQVA